MSPYEQARSDLYSRRTELLRRLTQVENDLEEQGGSIEATLSGQDSESATTTILADFMQTLTREIGLIESALRRIDSREYDCCLQCGCTIEAERLERLPYGVNCRSCSADFPVDYVHQLRSHHSSLRRTIFNLLNVLDETAERCAGTDEVRSSEVAGALALIRDLGRHLPPRFEMEERGGYLADALAAAPRYSRRAAALMKEHREFSQRMDALVKEIEPAKNSSTAWATTRDRFRQLALDLLAHEQAEADIIESAFLDDLGGID